MKNIIFLLSLLVCTHYLFAQQKVSSISDTSIHTIDLEGVVVNAGRTNKVSNSVHSENVYMVISPQKPNDPSDSSYFVTRFPKLDSQNVLLESVKVKLKAFDTSLFDIMLVVFQANKADSSFNLVSINNINDLKRNRLTLKLVANNIILQPNDFYIGYGFHKKNIHSNYSYRMFSSSNGEGSILTIKNGRFSTVSDEHIPYVFPFEIAYRKI